MRVLVCFAQEGSPVGIGTYMLEKHIQSHADLAVINEYPPRKNRRVGFMNIVFREDRYDDYCEITRFLTRYNITYSEVIPTQATNPFFHPSGTRIISVRLNRKVRLRRLVQLLYLQGYSIQTDASRLISEEDI
jgi:hypothetical protein